MSGQPETIAYCHSCGSPMDVTPVAPFSNVECPECSKHTRVKREFGPYTLMRRHAVGGMSMVFVAHDNTLDREVALKILSEEYSADERRIAAFEEEARITASFSHPHVVRVLTTGKAFGRFYIAMELVPGGHFEHQIRERGKIPEVEMLSLAIEVAQGLKAAHAAGLIHRDVKPGNILLDADGRAKLVDFGLALVTQGGKAQATEVWATPYYVPPETIEGMPEDFRSDIYAFGATLYHALAGVPSCGEESMATEILREAKKKVVPLGTTDPTLSVATCEIVDRAMAYDPKNRFPSYDEMIVQLEVALKRLLSGKAGSTESSGSAARRRARTRRGEWISVAAAVVVLLGAVWVGIWWVTRPDEDLGKRQTAILNPPVTGESTSAASTGVARSYLEARAAVEARDFVKAAEGFVKLHENPEVQEPTRTWAGVEAVVATYLDGRSTDAKRLARDTSAHAAGVPEANNIGSVLKKTLDKLSDLPGIPSTGMDRSLGDPQHVMAWLLSGLKNWEQGLTAEAGAWFSAVTEAKISSDDGWLKVYQEIAADYQVDRATLSAKVFEKLPADAAGCEAAVAELDKILPGLKTRGRARFNLRAWQLDLAKHSKLLPSPNAPKPAVPRPTAWESVSIMAKLDALAKDCLFAEASSYIKSLSADPQGATRLSLLSVTDASAVFFADLDDDLAKGPVTGEFPLRSGKIIRKIAAGENGSLTVTDAAGLTRAAKWADFSPDAVIALHRLFVKNPASELERLRRHECAISYDWLAGNRERALAAAALLSQGSLSFKQRWEMISAGLPK